MAHAFGATPEERIGRNFERYLRALRTRDWSLLEGMVAPGCTVRYGPSPEYQGRSGLVAAIRGYLRVSQPLEHHIDEIGVTRVSEHEFECRGLLRSRHRHSSAEKPYWAVHRYRSRWRIAGADIEAVNWAMDQLVWTEERLVA